MDLCHECGQTPPVYVCKCSGIEVRLCEAHIGIHCQRYHGYHHSFESIRSKLERSQTNIPGPMNMPPPPLLRSNTENQLVAQFQQMNIVPHINPPQVSSPVKTTRPDVKCSGCNHLPITGPVMKCETCPNFYFCSDCHRSKPHSSHVFKPQLDEIHPSIYCDGCRMTPIMGKRMKCDICPDFDFCEKCFREKSHARHEFSGAPDENHGSIPCDGCRSDAMVGQRWKCGTCPNFNFCERCHLTRKHEHPLMRVVLTCSGCRKSPLTGDRWRCLTCTDFNLCSSCHSSKSHPHSLNHHYWNCDGCQTPITGQKWKCLMCTNFDYCEACYRTEGQKHASHSFTRVLVQCDGCNEKPIMGAAYRCSECVRFHYCAKCFNIRPHEHRDFRKAGWTCSECGVTPIVDQRWQCTTCPNCDMCDTCYHQKAKSHHPHAFTQI